MIAVVVVLLLVVMGFLLLAGICYVGPFKYLAVFRPSRRYDSRTRQGEIVFYGASNFTLWKEMEEDLAPYPVQNHGFGNSADVDLVRYADKLLYPYVPKIVVFQTGSNDYLRIEGDDAKKIRRCMENKRRMFSDFHSRLPDAKFIVMSGLLLPGRKQFLALTQEINQELQELCATTPYMRFIDASAMTYNGETFHEELFRKDGIHLNHTGQLRWAQEYILPVLQEEWNLKPTEVNQTTQESKS